MRFFDEFGDDPEWWMKAALVIPLAALTLVLTASDAIESSRQR